MPTEELAEYYKAADVFVLPTREDIWGLVVNEAMAHGLPIISTNKCNSAKELIRGGSAGFIIPPDDPDELSQRIMELVDKSDHRERMSQNSLRISREHTIERMASEYVKLFHKITKNP
jgi:glycosyltransferase involved in cell wall biosynthesis